MLIVCGGCRKKLKVEDTLAGQLGRCPACNSVIKIPTAHDGPDRSPDASLPTATVVPDPFGQAAGPQGQPSATLSQPLAAGGADLASLSGGVSSAPSMTPPTVSSTPVLKGVPTDEHGYVLAIPVDEENLPKSAPTGEEGDLGYPLKDEVKATEGSAPSTPVAVGQQGDLSAGLNRIPEKIITRCPGCGGRLAIEAQYAGKMRTCPGCGAEVRVPLRSTEKLSGVAVEGTGAIPPRKTRASAIPTGDELPAEVDLESYGPMALASARGGVSGFWVAIALVIGLVIGFAAGMVAGKLMFTPIEPASGPPPTTQAEGPA